MPLRRSGSYKWLVGKHGVIGRPVPRTLANPLTMLSVPSSASPRLGLTALQILLALRDSASTHDNNRICRLIGLAQHV
ncbi:hypothetical protein LZ31DRAFT_315116 [Colletotrichum somersetense]|nr:hypothetical protein LZ31DRAFT_315116 [Colletotrichum somersetense]